MDPGSYGIRDADSAGKLASIIHQGEAKSIQIAEEIVADLLILDDSSARQIAKMKGLNVVGTLAILRQAKEELLIHTLY